MREGEKQASGRVPSLAWRMGVAAVLAVTFVALDQITKSVVRAAVLAGALPVSVIPGVLDFTFVANDGVAFGLASGYGYTFVVLAAVVVAFTVAYLWRAPKLSRLEVAGLGMLVGGAVGNAWDRLVHGFVTDFISATFIGFPVFNVADIGITVGVVLAFVGFIFLSPANEDARLRAEADRAERLGRGGEKKGR